MRTMNNALVPVAGSLQQVAEETGMMAMPDAVVLVDTSWSMEDTDARNLAGELCSRWESAKEQLELLQAQLPGRIALICFGDHPEFVPSGHLSRPAGMTYLDRALAMARELDTGTMRFVVITDGDASDRDAALAVAQTFRSPIDGVYIGTDPRGEQFLRGLCAATGGTFSRDGSGVRLLAQTIAGLLSAPMVTE